MTHQLVPFTTHDLLLALELVKPNEGYAVEPVVKRALTELLFIRRDVKELRQMLDDALNLLEAQKAH